MEAVAVLIMLSHHLQGFYVMSIISKYKIAMEILLLSSTETAILKNSHLVYWHFMLFFYHMQQIIYLGSPMLAGWLQQYGANYCRLVTVSSPMRDRPSQRGTTSTILYEQCVPFFNVPQIVLYVQWLWDRDCSWSSLFEKTRKSNHLQMPSQQPAASFSVDWRLSRLSYPGGVWQLKMWSRVWSVHSVLQFVHCIIFSVDLKNHVAQLCRPSMSKNLLSFY